MNVVLSVFERGDRPRVVNNRLLNIEGVFINLATLRFIVVGSNWTIGRARTVVSADPTNRATSTALTKPKLSTNGSIISINSTPRRSCPRAGTTFCSAPVESLTANTARSWSENCDQFGQIPYEGGIER